jgi:hypothetical protein
VFVVLWSCGEFDVHSFDILPYTIWLLDCIYFSVTIQELNWIEVTGVKHVCIFPIIPRHGDLRITLFARTGNNHLFPRWPFSKEVQYDVLCQNSKMMVTSNFILLRNWPKFRLESKGNLTVRNRPSTGAKLSTSECQHHDEYNYFVSGIGNHRVL